MKEITHVALIQTTLIKQASDAEAVAVETMFSLEPKSLVDEGAIADSLGVDNAVVVEQKIFIREV